MKITVTAELDDGTKIEAPITVDSSGNPRFWSQGVKRGSDAATELVGQMVEAAFGGADYEGIHIVKGKK